MGTTEEMVDERLRLESEISKLIYAFQNKWECGIEIHDYTNRAFGKRFDQFTHLYLEIKK
jgi:hypothetical protein